MHANTTTGRQGRTRRAAPRQPSRRVWLAVVRPETPVLSPEAQALFAAVLEWTPTPEFLAAEARMTAALELEEVTTWGRHGRRPAHLRLVKGGGTR